MPRLVLSSPPASLLDLTSRHPYREHRAQIEEWRGRTRV